MRAPVRQAPVLETLPSTVPAPRVLVVNSTTSTRARICDLLTAAGYAPVGCASAAAALAALQHAPPVAAIVDYMLDDMSGFAFVQACTNAGERPAIIMTAGRGEVSAAVRAVREGVADFLPGPVDGRLVQALRAALRARQTRLAINPHAPSPE